MTNFEKLKGLGIVKLCGACKEAHPHPKSQDAPFHYHILLVLTKSIQISKNTLVNKVFGGLQFHARRIVKFQPALARYFIKAPLEPSYLMTINNGEYKELPFEQYIALLGSVNNDKKGMWHSVLEMVQAGCTKHQIVTAHPSLGGKIDALQKFIAFVNMEKQNTWENSKPLEVNAARLLMGSNSETDQILKIVRDLNLMRNQCVNKELITGEGFFCICGKTGIHKTSLFYHLQRELGWPIVFADALDNYPGEAMAAFPEESRPLIVWENADFRLPLISYQRAEMILNANPGTYLQVKGAVWRFHSLRNPYVFLTNNDPLKWFRHAATDPTDPDDLGPDQLTAGNRAAFDRRFKGRTYYLTQAMNFFDNPDGAGLRIENNKDEEEQKRRDFYKK